MKYRIRIRRVVEVGGMRFDREDVSVDAYTLQRACAIAERMDGGEVDLVPVVTRRTV